MFWGDENDDKEVNDDNFDDDKKDEEKKEDNGDKEEDHPHTNKHILASTILHFQIGT